jgi:hypothetical protein
MSSFRDRFLTPGVARATTSPSAIVATGAGAAAAILLGLGPLGAVALGLGAYGARVLAAVPRAPKRPGIAPRSVGEPWRGLIEDVLDARRRYDQALDGVRPGPLRDRLGEVGGRLDTAVDEAWRIASAGNTLSVGRRRIDTDAIRRDLQAASAAPHSERSEQTVTAIRSQLESADRLDRTIYDTYERLRLLDARIDETVTRTVELSVTQADLSDLGGLDTEVESIVGEMEALRQAVEETGGPALPDLGPLADPAAQDPSGPAGRPGTTGQV